MFLHRIATYFNRLSLRYPSPLIMQNLKPDAHVYQMQKLNRDAFTKVIKVPVLHADNMKMSSVLPLMKKFLLKLEKFKPIVRVNSDNTLVYLNPELITKYSDLPLNVRTGLENLTLTEDNVKFEDFILNYDNYGAEAILEAVLPKENEGFSSYTKVGHIVHVNLREHLEPYKELIGEVLFDKVKACESVVNKVNIIDNAYRNFEMEVIKGTNNMHTIVKENNCRFEFDFSKVYWNSRLCTEHSRIVKQLRPNGVLFDVFAGVGPFAIPAGKKKCLVYANDLNPESYKWLMHNKKLNKIPDEYFHGSCLDGRDFIQTVIKENLPKFIGRKQVIVTMNLPALAVEFLDTFIGLLSNKDIPNIFEPVTVFVYCFAKGEHSEETAKSLIRENLPIKNIDSKIGDIFKVRTVSSMKEFMRVTLNLDRDILVGATDCKRKNSNEYNKDLKKNCYDVCLSFFEDEMTKNKKKMNNVFKIAGAKSLKLKSKAKIVKSELKNIKVKNKEKILEIDKALERLEEKLRTSASQISETSSKKPTTTPLPQKSSDDNTDEAGKQAVGQLEVMKL